MLRDRRVLSYSEHLGELGVDTDRQSLARVFHTSIMNRIQSLLMGGGRVLVCTPEPHLQPFTWGWRALGKGSTYDPCSQPFYYFEIGFY